MAGGPNAALAACMYCAGPSDRVREGIEIDSFVCRECGAEFGLDFDAVPPPDRPLWPIGEHEARMTRMRAFAMGRRELSLVWGDVEHVLPADRTRWTIGRHPDCDVQILSRSLAKTHAVLAMTPHGFVLRDPEDREERDVREDEPLDLAPDVEIRLIGRTKK